MVSTPWKWCPYGCGKKVHYQRDYTQSTGGIYKCEICDKVFTKYEIENPRLVIDEGSDDNDFEYQ